jgi:hypothetical protein
VAVLQGNDLGGWTKPAPRLYPHQWSWDSAVISIGLAHIDPDRALRELESLFAAQWADGRVPQIVYDAVVPPEAYFPDADRWACAQVATTAPAAPATSGIVQPPLHAVAAWRICQVAAGDADKDGERPPLRERLCALYPKLLAWHRYLATARDPEASGLITIYHPWESGTDNSPRWDAPLANVAVGDLPPYTRRDLQHVDDPSHRPTDAEYDRYLWLVESLKVARYDDAEAHRSHPFLVKDVLFSAIFVAANHALAELATRLQAPDSDHQQVRAWAARFSKGVRGQWDAGEQLALDLDMRTDQSIPVRTCAGLAPLLVPDLEPRLVDRLEARLFGPAFAGSPALAFAVVPSTAPDSAGFRQRTYWRGPVWPVANWLLWLGLRWIGRKEAAARLRDANLALLGQPSAHFAEYFDPFSGEPLGSLYQSWTAAIVLDWLAVE